MLSYRWSEMASTLIASFSIDRLGVKLDSASKNGHGLALVLLLRYSGF